MEASCSPVGIDSKRMFLSDAEIEIELCSFYEQLVKEIYIVSHLEFSDIWAALRNIRSYKNPEIELHRTVSFDKAEDRLSYVFAYCLIHSAVMYQHFSRLLKTNPSLLEKIISMKTMNLCCLGGGPGFEAVSLCKVLSDALSKLNGERPLLRVRVTVIDVCNGWEEDAKEILRSAEQNLLSQKNIEIDLSFIEADLTGDFSEEVKEAIKRSHFVTMFKFLSDVAESSYKKSEVTDLVQKIIETMSFKACLFYLDTSGGGLFKKIECLIDGLPCTSNIYGPYLHNCYQLSLDSLETFHNSLKHILRDLKCTNRVTISCSVWVKVRHILQLEKLSLCSSAKPNTSSEALPKVKPKKVKIKKLVQSPAVLEETMDDID